MKIVLGSKNESKRLAVADAFSEVFPDDAVQVKLVDADSGVSSHPVSGSESIKGALNRIKHARNLQPGADYYIGIEGGLLQVEGRFWEIGWVAIENNQGKVHTGISSGLELKGVLLDDIKNGLELNKVLEKRFGIKDIGKANGFNGLATDDLVTRREAYRHGIIFALAPFKNPAYFVS